MADTETDAVVQQVQLFTRRIAELRGEIAKSVVGNRDVVDGVVTCMLAGGHALLEGVPGLRKTIPARTMAEPLSLTFSPLHFTPALIPPAPPSPTTAPALQRA